MNSKLLYTLIFTTLTLLFCACSESDSVLPQTNIPIQFSTGVNAVSEVTSRADDNSEADIINSVSDLVGKQVSLFGAEYLTGNTPTETSWNFMRYWKADVNSGGVLNYASVPGQQLKYYSPENGFSYNFVAVYPPVGGSNSGVSSNSTGAFPSLRIQLQYRPDLMVADAIGRTKPNADVNIPLEFEHQLVLVSFNIYKTPVNPANPLEHNIYLNKMTMAGRTMADFNPVTKVFSNVNAKTGATIRIPGYPYSSFEVEEAPAKKVRDIFLFTANGDNSTERYEFTFELNEVPYSIILPREGKTWEAGKKYIYNIKVVGSDVYIEVEGDGGSGGTLLQQEKWEDKDNNTIIDGQ